MASKKTAAMQEWAVQNVRLNPRDQIWSLDRKQVVFLSNPMVAMRLYNFQAYFQGG